MIIEQLGLYPQVTSSLNIILLKLCTPYIILYPVVVVVVLTMSWLLFWSNPIPFASLLLCWCLFVSWTYDSRKISLQNYIQWVFVNCIWLLIFISKTYICNGGSLLSAITWKKNCLRVCVLLFKNVLHL